MRRSLLFTASLIGAISWSLAVIAIVVATSREAKAAGNVFCANVINDPIQGIKCGTQTVKCGWFQKCTLVTGQDSEGNTYIACVCY